ncbi:hypothetical protein CRUP_014858, partial [Coryphaenoides rupestris]
MMIDDEQLESCLSAQLGNTRRNNEYEIVAPYEVDHRGHFLSHEITHQQRGRRRRSLQPDASPDATANVDANADADASGNDDSETVHFRLSGLGQDFHLELRESSASLLAPGFTVQVLRKPGGDQGPKADRRHHHHHHHHHYHRRDLCFYQGSLRSRVNSSVALSTCAGM